MRSIETQPDQWLKYGLLILYSFINVLQWQAVLQRDNPELLATNLLVCIAIASLLWDQRETFSAAHNSKGNGASSFLGATLLLLVLCRSLVPGGYHPRLSFWLSNLGILLLASGYQGLKSYWQTLTVASLLMVEPLLRTLLQVIDLPHITASFSTTALSLVGFAAQQQGNFILLPTGRVEVYGDCSGIGSVVQMCNLALVLALTLPSKSWVKQLSFILAPILGFSVNALRVALLTVLVSQSKMTEFHYWHDDPNASLVFFLIATIIFMGFYAGTLHYCQTVPPDSD